MVWTLVMSSFCKSIILDLTQTKNMWWTKASMQTLPHSVRKIWLLASIYSSIKWEVQSSRWPVTSTGLILWTTFYGSEIIYNDSVVKNMFSFCFMIFILLMAQKTLNEYLQSLLILDTETETHSMFYNCEMWNNSGAKLSIEKSRWDLTFIRNRLWEQREGWTWSLGLVDANYYI